MRSLLWPIESPIAISNTFIMAYPRHVLRHLTEPLTVAAALRAATLRSSGAVLRPAGRTCGTCLRRPAVGYGTSVSG